MVPSKQALAKLYGNDPQALAIQAKRYEKLRQAFTNRYPAEADLRFVSSPGRTEIGGNHTDHQSGRVLAASIQLDTVAAVAANDGAVVNIDSEGFPPIQVDLTELAARDAERGTTAAVVRGCAARMQALGYRVGGFDAAVTSSVLVGSGLSSSAAFEVLVCTIFDNLFNEGAMPPVLRAQISQFAENNYFGKPSGLMDQTASSVGGIVAIDFREAEPEVTALQYDFAAKGYVLAVVNTGGSHDDLTDAYAAIRAEMEQVAALFGQSRLRFVDPQAFDEQLPALHGKVSDRALLRAMHFFDENARVPQMVEALERNDLEAFFALIIASGDSSWKLLQNVWASPQEQPISLALALSERMLRGRGAWRIHGGGFAGTILAFVPTDGYAAYRQRMDAMFGAGACCLLNIRQVGACMVEA